jgi:hypothetical protein
MVCSKTGDGLAVSTTCIAGSAGATASRVAKKTPIFIPDLHRGAGGLKASGGGACQPRLDSGTIRFFVGYCKF